ncbi:4Fe-4S binding protein [Desulforudis sp. 1088]|uniref:4Fe-4S binding protein n=1 Tax=unclassified Candidatus Desulforudis TaxID=2635950 RepID=UPI0034924D0D
MASRGRLWPIPRRAWQLMSALLANSYWPGFASGTIYQGAGKNVCVPFLNCYSCPGAVGSCPVGSFQFFLAGPGQTVSLYVLGTVTGVGALVGRLVCGWLCPFGLLQEVMARPCARRVKLPGILLTLKYAVLVLTVSLPVLAIGAYGTASPYFCKYLCPAGTLEAGVLLALGNPAIRGMLGSLFLFKLAILVLLLILMVFVYRPFCRTVCPLGAFYSFFNAFSLWRLEWDHGRCTGCHSCRSACPLGLAVDRTPNHPECIRCLDCTRVCPSGALQFTSGIKREESVVFGRDVR